MNFPDVRLWETDIKELAAEQVMHDLGLVPGELDLLCGGPPCQGFSKYNSHRSPNDKRNDLVLQFEWFVQELLPKAVLLENVPGLKWDDRFAMLKRTLRDQGYVVAAKVLDAAGFGVPQRRKRLILLAGYRREIPLANGVSSRRTVRDTIFGLPLPGSSDDPLHNLSGEREERVKKVISLIPHDGGSWSDLSRAQQHEVYRRRTIFSDIYGRLSWDDVAPTITGGCGEPSQSRCLHPDQDRTITLREAALLQSFPPEFRFSMRRGKTAVARMIGNAFPPEFARQLAVAAKKEL